VGRYRVLLGALAALAFAPSAHAAVPSVLGGVSCTSPAADAVRECVGDAPTFDGMSISVNVVLPPANQGDGPFPAIGLFHGWGGEKVLNDRMRDWARRGYLAFSMTDRGFNDSCGPSDLPDRLDPTKCQEGHVRLMDTRYEVRDAQHFFGLLADEGRIVPDKIGVTGGSYGGGISMALAALRNRVMLPNETIVPWQSPQGKPMEIAVALPEIPWTDLAYSLMPNGRTLDYVADNRYLGPDGDYPIGVMKQTFVAGLYGLGQATGTYAVPGTDPDADLTSWFGLINAGEPYDENPLARDIVDEILAHHSSYYIPRSTEEYGSTAPAPLLISNGWTDDLFPPDEAIRFYNRTRAEFPGNDISLYFLDYGHQRGQSKAADVANLRAVQEVWLDHYLKGVGPKPDQGATAITQTCPKSAPSEGPFTAPSWDELSPGEVRFTDEGSKTIAPGGGNPEAGQAFDPISGPGACATSSGQDAPGTATYRLPAATGNGYTLLGSPTVIADIEAPSPTSQVAARLVDVAPDGKQTLVARGLYRPDAEGRQVFQLHANGWRFADGHVPKLELLPNDAPYSRPSNGQGPVTISNLDLRLPVRESIGDPAPAVLPPGTQAAPGVEAAGGCGTGLSQKGTKANERLKGTAGGDRLRGGKGNDRLAGKDGDDCLNGGKGKDRIAGGDGDDKVKARDGQRDRVNCGKGEDALTADRKDRVRGCEKVKRR
jgi:fermentation-respiration switch protein FrsA (DUF1100 family)